jgi:hypothetical protein
MTGLPGVRKVLLKDLDDPAVGIVSFVKNPAVRDAKFFALKSEAASGARMPTVGLGEQIRSLPSKGDAGMPRAAMKNRS